MRVARRVRLKNAKGRKKGRLGICVCKPTKLASKSAYPTVWKELREKKQLIDGIVESSDGKTYRVHRVILAATSEYFRTLFSSSLAVNSTYCKIPVHSSAVDCVLDFCYTGECFLTPETVQTVLPAADLLGVLDLIGYCCRYLKAHITVENVLGVHAFAQAYFCTGLANTCKFFVLANFPEIVESAELVELPLHDLKALLINDHLNVPSEEIGFKAVNRWIMHDLENRQIFATPLLGALRLGRLSPTFFHTQVLSAPYSGHISSSLLWATRTAMEHVLGNSGEILATEPNISVVKLSRPRTPMEVIFAVGGWSAGSPTNVIEAYDIRADRWFVCPYNDIISRSYHGLVCIDQLLYMIGGFDGTVHFNTVRCFNPNIKEWSEKACMYHIRCYVCCVTMGKCIYALGGYNGRTRMRTVEKYSVETNQWELMPPMLRHRSDGGAVVVENKIYVAGGFNGQEVLSCSEMYDSETKLWIRLPHMNTARSGVSLVYYKGFIYAIGGFDGHSRLNTVERLNPRQPTAWTTDVPHMAHQRSNFACSIIEEFLYVIGGFDGTTTTGVTERFDGENWTQVSSMNVKRSALAACVCRGLKNASAFTANAQLQQVTPRGENGLRGTAVKSW